ncbi:MAG TPA: cytochrome P450 [Roseiflexaceae bacterium]|nr:cytochrome P450 [Roseiflexaceae bacterium]
MPPHMQVSIATPAFKANPYPFYARLRAEAPVCSVSLPTRNKVYLIARYDDALLAVKDPRLLKDAREALTPEQFRRLPLARRLIQPMMKQMLDQDPPNHTRLRALVHKAFTPRRIDQLAERIQLLADALLDAAAPHGRIDLIAQYALPIPATVIAEMLGVPLADRAVFQRWSTAIVSMNGSRWAMVQALSSVVSFRRYVRRLMAQRRVDPQDDLLTALLQAEEAGDQLSEAELVAMVMLLLVAGFETTVNLIGNGVFSLLRHPEQRERLQAEPALIKTAVEELLRYEGPLETTTERFAGEDMELGGALIPQGSPVRVVLASANRDETQFDQPDRLDITRTPNRHLAFGQGIHYCLGAPLARLEGQIAINTLLRRMPDLRLAVPPEAVSWRSGLLMRGLETLPLTFTPSSAAVNHRSDAEMMVK